MELYAAMPRMVSAGESEMHRMCLRPTSAHEPYDVPGTRTKEGVC